MVNCVGCESRSLKSVPLTGTVALSSDALRTAQLAFLRSVIKARTRKKGRMTSINFVVKRYS